jgi:hypothetical protein
MRAAASPQQDAAPQATTSQAAMSGAHPSRLVVTPAHDPAEREADIVAARILAGAAALPLRAASSSSVQRACADCEGAEERLDRAAKLGATAPRIGPGGGLAPASVTAALAGPGQGLDAGLRNLARVTLGEAAAGARIHRGAAADRAARSVGARAFTVGRDIVFADGEYAPETGPGRALMLHELVHVAQQARGVRRVQRACTHDGTPVNCHNWTIPLPPWIAGTIAHSQISALLAIQAKQIPRATKRAMGSPTTPSTTPGYADLWRQNPGSVSIGEIKSTATGSGVAAAEAAHYVLRHGESMARGPTALDDLAYHTALGFAVLPAAPLDLSGFTTTAGRSLGPFVGDPLKQLWIEGDNLGAVVYWCTGLGTLNPVWLVALRRALKRLKRGLDQLREMMEELIDGVVSAGRRLARWIGDAIGDLVEWGEQNSRVLAILALCVIAVIAAVLFVASLLAEAPSGGTSTVPAIGSLAALGASMAGILALLGFSTPGLPEATGAAAAAAFPATADAEVTGSSYDRPGDAAPRSLPRALAQISDDPGAQFLAALEPLGDAEAIGDAVLSLVSEGVSEARARGALRSSLAALRAVGDEASAASIEARMSEAGVA